MPNQIAQQRNLWDATRPQPAQMALQAARLHLAQAFNLLLEAVPGYPDGALDHPYRNCAYLALQIRRVLDPYGSDPTSSYRQRLEQEARGVLAMLARAEDADCTCTQWSYPSPLCTVHSPHRDGD